MHRQKYIIIVLFIICGYIPCHAQFVFVKAHPSDSTATDSTRHARHHHKKTHSDTSNLVAGIKDTTAHIKKPNKHALIQIDKSTYSYGLPDTTKKHRHKAPAPTDQPIVIDPSPDTAGAHKKQHKPKDKNDMYVVEGDDSYTALRKTNWDSALANPGIHNNSKVVYHTANDTAANASYQPHDAYKSKDNNRTDSATKVDDAVATIIIDTAQLYMDSAHYYMRLGDYRDVSAFTGLVINKYRGGSQYAEALFLNGQVALAAGDDAGAMDDFSLAIDAARSQPETAAKSYLWRGLLYYKQDKNDQALADFNTAIKMDSAGSSIRMAYYYRGNCYRDKDMAMMAMMNYTMFINADNSSSIYSADAMFNRAFYKMKLGDDRGAIRDYDKSFDIYVAARSARKDAAYQKEYNEKIVQVLTQRALAKSNIQHYDEAITDYNEVVKLRPNYALAYRLRGLAKIKKGQKDAGCLDLSHAGELGNIEAYDDIKNNCK